MLSSSCEFDRHRYGEQKNCAISHPLLNEGSCIREYSTIRLLSNRHRNDLKEMYSIGLNFEYSRMNVPSLSSGCEIAQFFVRYMDIIRDSTGANATCPSARAISPLLDEATASNVETASERFRGAFMLPKRRPFNLDQRVSSTVESGIKNIQVTTKAIISMWPAKVALSGLGLNQSSATSPLFLDNLHFEHFIPPKRRFWKDEQKRKSGFSKHFSRA